MKSYFARRLAPLTVGPAVCLAASLSGAFFAPARAQSAPNPLATRTKARVASLFQTATRSAQELRLSPSQQDRLKGIAQRNMPLARAIWSDNSLSQSQKLGKIRALKAQTAAVFTPAQKQKLQVAQMSAMTQLFQTASWVSSELNLSVAQRETIQSLVLKSYRQSSGTASGGAAGSFGTLRDLIQDSSGRISAILTPAQRAKWSVIQGAARSELVRGAKVVRSML